MSDFEKALEDRFNGSNDSLFIPDSGSWFSPDQCAKIGARWAREWCFMNGHNPEVCKEIDDILTKLRTENQLLKNKIEKMKTVITDEDLACADCVEAKADGFTLCGECSCE